MSTPTDGNPDLLAVIAHVTAKPGEEAELRRELEASVGPTSKEDGFAGLTPDLLDDSGLTIQRLQQIA